MSADTHTVSGRKSTYLKDSMVRVHFVANGASVPSNGITMATLGTQPRTCTTGVHMYVKLQKPDWEPIVAPLLLLESYGNIEYECDGFLYTITGPTIANVDLLVDDAMHEELEVHKDLPMCILGDRTHVKCTPL